MKKVTLYQVNKTEKIVSGDHLELRQYSYDQITPIRNSDEVIVENAHSKTTNLLIQKYVFCQKNWKTGEVIENIAYACFDDELLKLIQCERSKFNELISENEILRKDRELLINTVDAVEKNYNTVYNAYEEYLSIGFWKRLVFLFRGKI